VVSRPRRGLNTLARELIGLGVDVEDLKDAFADIADSRRKDRGPATHPSARAAILTPGSSATTSAATAPGTRPSSPRAGPDPLRGSHQLRLARPQHRGRRLHAAVDDELGPFAPRMLERRSATSSRRGTRMTETTAGITRPTFDDAYEDLTGLEDQAITTTSATTSRS
jgi:hypothetical protein